MAHTEFNAGDDIIDVRDIIARVEELREELESVKDDTSEEAADIGLNEWCLSVDKNTHPFGNTIEELQTLEDLLGEMRGYGGDEQWEGSWYPVTLIHENYFEVSMDEILEECGIIPKDIPSYLTITVDYDMLKQDYSEVEFDGHTYFYR